MSPVIYLAVGIVVLLLTTFFAFARRYKRCPSDRILVVYGKIGNGRSSKCLHGGGTFIWPIIQDYQYLDLTPLPIDIRLEGALSRQNIRVNTPSTFTVGVSTEPGVMENAAERLLGLGLAEIKDLAKDIIFGQMRVVLATMAIEEINADRDKLIANISDGVEVELRKVGLRLINVNIQDITDASGYIDALGQEAASKAINEAKVKVALAQRDGEIGAAEARRDQAVRVAAAKAVAIEGENLAAIQVANSNADRRTKEAEANRLATAAEKVAAAKALEESYVAEAEAERQRASREKASQEANIIVPAEIDKQRIIVEAEAAAEKVRRTQLGEADAVRFLKQAEADGIKFVKEAEAAGLRMKLVAEAEGTEALLTKKAKGFDNIISACRTPEGAQNLLIVEQLPNIVAEQVKAISNLRIDKITVWDSGKNDANGKGSTANFLSGLVGSLPPLHELAANVGVKLPGYLGKPADAPAPTAPADSAPAPDSAPKENA